MCVTVTEALKVLRLVPKEQQSFQASLACGFTPLHLQLFLNAHLQERLPARNVVLTTGIYGSLAATLEEAERFEGQAVACACEWADLDPRLGYREGGAWSLDAIQDIITRSRHMLDRIRTAISRIPAGVVVAVSLPTLPLPPLFHTSGWEAGEEELLLDQSLAEFGARLTERKGTRIVNGRRLLEESPLAGRLDVKSDFATGLPYTISHADALAAALALLLVPPSPKKGVISDLDDTLWSGLVGEIGPEAVSWDLASHHQIHGVYQKLLGSLADSGVMVGVASKNDPAVVEQALRREDLLIQADRIFPIEVHWDAKSGSVGRILQRWNVGADAVVFVDDSPMELAEVAAKYPDITCLQFPRNDPRAALTLLRTLRDLCGKDRVSEDDALRLASIRRSADFDRESQDHSSPETFLQEADSEVTLNFEAGWEDSRALELVNKTNQFNINGCRYTERDWQAKLSRPDAFLLTVTYKDRFAPLGKIGVIAGRRMGATAVIETWVMSCRAFARRIEYQCAQTLFERFGLNEMLIEFAPTPKNGPARDFFAALCGERPHGAFSLTYSDFQEKCPPLYHHVSEVARAQTNG